ncbi:hypothetical protein [Microbacterium caowuchunii]|uniref:hypothetical protein n=1 Tax=Microbacterium caowuchunii TaxID=2614638 RepID=UPI00177A7CF8|nr:hypothetical protein [Microbacterium caowuchunii]
MCTSFQLTAVDGDVYVGRTMEFPDIEQDDLTHWVSIASLTARRSITRVQTSPSPLVVDLATTDFTGDAPRRVELTAGEFMPLAV